MPMMTTLALAPTAVSVAAEVRAEGQRPPQRLGLRGVADVVGQGGDDGLIVATYGMLSMIPDSRAETHEQQHRPRQRVPAGGVGGQPRPARR